MVKLFTVSMVHFIGIIVSSWPFEVQFIVFAKQILCLTISAFRQQKFLLDNKLNNFEFGNCL